jgi:hypothetical protein
MVHDDTAPDLPGAGNARATAEPRRNEDRRKEGLGGLAGGRCNAIMTAAPGTTARCTDPTTTAPTVRDDRGRATAAPRRKEERRKAG